MRKVLLTTTANLQEQVNLSVLLKMSWNFSLSSSMTTLLLLTRTFSLFSLVSLPSHFSMVLFTLNSNNFVRPLRFSSRFPTEIPQHFFYFSCYLKLSELSLFLRKSFEWLFEGIKWNLFGLPHVSIRLIHREFAVRRMIEFERKLPFDPTSPSSSLLVQERTSFEGCESFPGRRQI